ncbi:MAG: primosomal protein N' [Verrucomicrobiales bacterium]|nr:primosomal protein N' [Verrucomicrobiales bacterium]
MVPTAKVLVDGSSGLEFDYSIPKNLHALVVVGSRVKVNLRNRPSTGTVVDLSSVTEGSGEASYLKPISELITDKPILTPVLIELGRWISNYYVASMESVMRCLIPESVRGERHDFKRLLFAKLIKIPSEKELEGIRRKAKRQASILSELIETGAPVQISRLGAWARGAADGLVKKGFIELTYEIVGRDPHADEKFMPSQPLKLTDAQGHCLSCILEATNEPARAKPLLLHGVTGSGKTEVYLQAIAATISSGKTALILVPEISLTPQTVARFKRRFAEIQQKVAVLHSHLSSGERFDEWHKIVEGNAKIVIGARSALFAPLQNLGLIVVDEEHEGSYKQDTAPRYHARDVAVVRAKIERCVVVLGSATPSLESIHNTHLGKYQLIELKERVDDCSLPLIRIIDLKKEARNLSKSGGPAIISERLRTAVDERLSKGEQVILFLNRRGFATSLSCPSCGHVCGCPHCSVSLTFHRKQEKLVCHMCGYQRVAPRKCPECNDPSIRFAGYGTEKVEEILRKIFPVARLARVDTDTMSRKGALRKTLNDFKAAKLDILVGTQMIAKGLHFPNVTLVGILNADIGLHVPDFRAGERTFQLLTQVAGRAGRGEMEGEVIIQTFTPQSPSVQFARHHDYLGFSDQELEFRKSFSYPPYYHCLIVTVRSEHARMAEFTLQTLHRKLEKELPKEIIMGEPLESPLAKAAGQFRFQVMLRSPNPRLMTNYVRSITDKLTVPDEVAMAVDVDPLFLS